MYYNILRCPQIYLRPVFSGFQIRNTMQIYKHYVYINTQNMLKMSILFILFFKE
jgi:hypothetical protein